MTLRQAVPDSKIAGMAMAVIEVDATSEGAADAGGAIAVAAEGEEATVDLGASFHPRSMLHRGLLKIALQMRQRQKGMFRLFCRGSLWQNIATSRQHLRHPAFPPKIVR
jgi:hypothetical protein